MCFVDESQERHIAFGRSNRPCLAVAVESEVYFRFVESVCDFVAGFVKRFIYADTTGRVCPLRDEVCREYLIEYNKGRQHATHVLLNAIGLVVEQFNFNLPEEKLRYLY